MFSVLLENVYDGDIYNTNMLENPLVNVTQLAGGVLVKLLKYFEVVLNIFQFSRVWKIVEF